MKQRRLRLLIYSAVVAALYVVLTELASLVGLSGHIIQFRISEALCVLPAFFPGAIPALFIGCLLSNLLTGCMPLDILFGSLATLIGAVGAYLLRRYRYLIPLPTVIANVIIIPLVLRYVYEFPGAYWYFTLTVAVGEIACAYVLGILLHRILDRYKTQLFLQ